MRDPAIALLAELVSIDSVNPALVRGGAGETEIAEAVARHLEASGLRVITVGLNPSDQEFPHDDPWRRFPVARTSGRRSVRQLCGPPFERDDLHRQLERAPIERLRELRDSYKIVA